MTCFYYCFHCDSAAPDHCRGQNMTLISSDHHFFLYLSAGEFQFLLYFYYIFLIFQMIQKKHKLITVRWKKEKLNLYCSDIFCLRFGHNWFLPKTFIDNKSVTGKLICHFEYSPSCFTLKVCWFWRSSQASDLGFISWDTQIGRSFSSSFLMGHAVISSPHF